MIIALIVILLSIISTICIIIFKPFVTFKNHNFQLFFIPSLIGLIILLAFNILNPNLFFSKLIESSSMNPLKILILFLSMSGISIILDELGFFELIAYKILSKVNGKAAALFIINYIFVSILTIFTSNDIIILTLTPIILIFAKNAKINPIPFLVSEFIASNTASMLLIIGNPTNIYLATQFNIDFVTYFLKMLLPTIIALVVAFFILFLIFYKQINIKLESKTIDYKIKNKPLLIIAILILGITTLLLAISSYIDFPMYLISAINFILLEIIVVIFSIINYKKHHEKPLVLINSIKRLPYNLIPFLISMFGFVICLNELNILTPISEFISSSYSPLLVNGLFTLLSCNIINNIPTSLLFSTLLNTTTNINNIYVSIIATNIGAFLTPIGALAGIMWMSILKRHNIHYSFLSFMKYGLIVGIPTFLLSIIPLFFI